MGRAFRSRRPVGGATQHLNTQGVENVRTTRSAKLFVRFRKSIVDSGVPSLLKSYFLETLIDFKMPSSTSIVPAGASAS